MYRINLENNGVYYFVCFATLWISYLTGFGHGVLNSDGVCYLRSAESFEHGLSAAMHACSQAKWPFYSIIIAVLVSITKLSYINAAYLIDTFFSMMSAVFFIKIVSFLSLSNSDKHKHRIILWLSAFVILAANEYNSIKFYIVRDHGFWAFYLASIYFLLHYFNQKTLFNALAWCLSLMVATLFRIEGVIFLCGLPLLVFLEKEDRFFQKIKHYFQLNTLLIISAVPLVLGLIFIAPDYLGRLNEIPFQLSQGLVNLTTDFQLRSYQLSHDILNYYSLRYATWVLFFTILVCYVVSVVNNISLVYVALILYASFKKLLTLNRHTQLVLFGYIFINVCVTMIFFAEHMFLTKRYLIALALLLMMWVPFGLYELLHTWQQKKHWLMLASVLIFANLVGGIFEFGYSKQYIADAGLWLARNVPYKETIISNDLLVMYYSKHFGNELFEYEKEFKNINALSDQWKMHDYFALRINHKDRKDAELLLKTLPDKPFKVFANERGDEVIIYKNNTRSV